MEAAGAAGAAEGGGFAAGVVWMGNVGEPQPQPLATGLTAMLRQGHARFGASAPSQPTTDVDPDYTERRREMLREEVGEFEDAITADDLEQIAKEGADVIYVTAGTLTTHGINPDAA